MQILLSAIRLATGIEQAKSDRVGADQIAPSGATTCIADQ